MMMDSMERGETEKGEEDGDRGMCYRFLTSEFILY
jgi:hypothetical protein